MEKWNGTLLLLTVTVFRLIFFIHLPLWHQFHVGGALLNGNCEENKKAIGRKYSKSMGNDKRSLENIAYKWEAFKLCKKRKQKRSSQQLPTKIEWGKCIWEHTEQILGKRWTPTPKKKSSGEFHDKNDVWLYKSSYRVRGFSWLYFRVGMTTHRWNKLINSQYTSVHTHTHTHSQKRRNYGEFVKYACVVQHAVRRNAIIYYYFFTLSVRSQKYCCFDPLFVPTKVYKAVSHVHHSIFREFFVCVPWFSWYQET